MSRLPPTVNKILMVLVVLIEMNFIIHWSDVAEAMMRSSSSTVCDLKVPEYWNSQVHFHGQLRGVVMAGSDSASHREQYTEVCPWSHTARAHSCPEQVCSINVFSHYDALGSLSLLKCYELGVKFGI